MDKTGGLDEYIDESSIDEPVGPESSEYELGGVEKLLIVIRGVNEQHDLWLPKLDKDTGKAILDYAMRRGRIMLTSKYF